MSLVGYASIAIAPILTVVFVVKVAENSLDYSLQNTARQTLWLVTSRAAKYKAKLIIDTFFVRTGDVLSAGVVLLGARALSLGVRQLAPLNALFVCGWLAMAMFVARRNKERAAAQESEAAA